MTSLLLLSGGLDSSALAAWKRPDRCLIIDYGQAAAPAEWSAAQMVTKLLQLELGHLKIDCRSLGQGTLAGEPRSAHSLWDEFWPYRNQLLITLAAGWGIRHNVDEIWTGTIRSDNRHVDGTSEFYRKADALLRIQEGRMKVTAPAIELSCDELITASGISDEVLAWTHSCHVGPIACAQCAGCLKRQGALAVLGRLR